MGKIGVNEVQEFLERNNIKSSCWDVNLKSARKYCDPYFTNIIIDYNTSVIIICFNWVSSYTCHSCIMNDTYDNFFKKFQNAKTYKFVGSVVGVPLNDGLFEELIKLLKDEGSYDGR